MPDWQNQDIARFIRKYSIFAPNGEKSITKVQVEDIITLGRQACEVISITGPYLNLVPKETDQSKMSIMITAQSLFWPKIDYEVSFVYHDDIKIGTYSGSPEFFKGAMISLEDNRITIGEDSSQTHTLRDMESTLSERICFYNKQRYHVEVELAKFLGVTWAVSVKLVGISRPLKPGEPIVRRSASSKPESTSSKPGSDSSKPGSIPDGSKWGISS